MSILLQVEPKNVTNLLNALKKCQDPLIKHTLDEKTCVFTIEGVSDLHIETFMRDLKEEFSDFKELPFLLCLKEIPSRKSPKIEKKVQGFSMVMDCENLVDDYNKYNLKNMNDSDYKKLIIDKEIEKKEFIDEIFIREGSNCILDYTKEKSKTLKEVLKFVSQNGGICGEEMEGFVFKVYEFNTKMKDVLNLAEVFYTCQYSANTLLLQPISKVEIQTSKDTEGVVVNFLYSEDLENIQVVNKNENIVHISGEIAELKKKGFSTKLRDVSSGKAFLNYTFLKWKIVEGSPFVEGTESNELTKKYREFKHIKEKDISKDIKTL